MKDKVRLGDRWVGVGEPTFIIAEAGSNHDRIWDQAKQLIEAAAEAGADAVKLQLFTADDLYLPDAPQYMAVKAVELPPEWLPDLARYSAQCNLVFLASPFSVSAVDALAELRVPAYKVASSETVKLPLLKYIAAKQKPVLLSTGMCDLADIHEAVEVCQSENNSDIVLLQCTSLYPTPPSHVHLRAMDTLRAAFHLPVGFSDHTLDIIAPVAAVARGACVIEKHLTIDQRLPGPDHSYALEPAGFRKMVQAIRDTEGMLGSPVKRMLPEEAQAARRESIRAARDIAVGEVLTRDLLVVERPAHGIAARFLPAVIGRKSRKPIARGEAITWEKI